MRPIFYSATLLTILLINLYLLPQACSIPAVEVSAATLEASAAPDEPLVADVDLEVYEDEYVDIEEYTEEYIEPTRDTAALPSSCEVPPAPEPLADEALPSLPAAFPAILTDVVVRQAVQAALEGGGDFRSANYHARDSAFRFAAAEAGVPLLHETYGTWRLRLLDLARAYLSDPERLEATWSDQRAAILEELERAGASQQVKQVLDEAIIPVFSRDIDELREIASEVGERHAQILLIGHEHPCRKLVLSRYDASLEYLVLLEPRADILQWRLRREAEGGTALTDAWLAIFTDLADALE